MRTTLRRWRNAFEEFFQEDPELRRWRIQRDMSIAFLDKTPVKLSPKDVAYALEMCHSENTTHRNQERIEQLLALTLPRELLHLPLRHLRYAASRQMLQAYVDQEHLTRGHLYYLYRLRRDTRWPLHEDDPCLQALTDQEVDLMESLQARWHGATETWVTCIEILLSLEEGARDIFFQLVTDELTRSELTPDWLEETMSVLPALQS